jgi:argininosuccinate synthase
MREKLHIEQIWVREAVEGRWFGALRTAADAFIASVSQSVTGTIRMHLSPGGIQITSIRCESPLYIRDREEWEAARARLR